MIVMLTNTVDLQTSRRASRLLSNLPVPRYPFTMAESSSSSTLAAELKAKHAEAAHHVEVEEVPDEDIMSHHHAEAEASSAGAKPSWAEPKAEEKPKKPEAKPLDTRSHDLFPELGGQSNSKSPAGIVPIWSAKSTTNGKTNGTNGTPRTSAPDSGVSTPTGTGQHGPPSLSIPGRNVETLYLEPQHMMPRTQMKRPLPDILKDLNRRSRAQVTMSTQGNGKLKFEAAGPQDIAAQALKELVQQIGTKVCNITLPQRCLGRSRTNAVYSKPSRLRFHNPPGPTSSARVAQLSRPSRRGLAHASSSPRSTRANRPWMTTTMEPSMLLWRAMLIQQPLPGT